MIVTKLEENYIHQCYKSFDKVQIYIYSVEYSPDNMPTRLHYKLVCFSTHVQLLQTIVYSSL